MFSALNLGTGLNGFIQGYQQQQQAAQQSELLKQALLKDRQQQGALALALSTLKGNPNLFSGGAGNPPAGGFPMGSAPPVPSVPTPQTADSVPQPPAPGDASTPAAPSPPPSQPSSVTTSYNVGMASPPANYPVSSDTPAWARASGGASGLMPRMTAYGGSMKPTVSQPAAPPATQAQPAAAPPPAAQQIATGQTPGTPEQHNEIGQYLQQYLHTTPLNEIAQAVMKANPNADPATAMMATQELFKMSIQGSTLDKAIAAQIMGGLYKNGMLQLGQERVATTQRGQDIASADRSAQRAVTERGQDLAHSDRVAGRAATQSRFDANQVNKAKAAANGAQKTEMAAVETQVRNANSRIAQLQAAAQTSDVQKQTAQAMKDRDALVAKYDAMVGRLLGQQPAQ